MLNNKVKVVMVSLAFLAGLLISATHNPLIGAALLFSTVMLIELSPESLRRLVITKQ